jgi:CubicO group peptidase (beta-lactamase class C family)
MNVSTISQQLLAIKRTDIYMGKIKSIKRLILFNLSLLAFFLQGFAQQSDKEAKLQDLIRSVNIPGIQLIYSKDGHAESYNLGVIADRSTVPVTGASIFEAASLSKAVFAYTVLRLVDRGVISLDTPLLHYIGGSNDQFYPGNPSYGKITTRMVLCHRTGFRNWRDADKIRLLFPPDSCFNYSGEGYMFLLAVIQKITHKDLEQLAEEETFIPLGIQNSSFIWNPKFAAVSTFGADSGAVRDHSDLNAASSLLTNAIDYDIFLNALSSGIGLKPESHKLMLSIQTPGNWFNHPVIDATAHISWGLGVGIQQNEKGKAYWQWGDNGGYKAFYLVLPETNEHLVYFTHSFRGLYIAQEVVDLFLGKQTTWAIQWVENGYASPLDIGYANPYAVATLRKQLLKNGFSNAPNIWAEEKKRNPAFWISEQDMRTFAGILSEAGQKKNAVEVLKLNVGLYPQNVDALEGLAQGYLDIGNSQLAIFYAKKCLAIDQTSKNATSLLNELTGK